LILIIIIIMTEGFRSQPENPKQHAPEAGAGPLGIPPPPGPEQTSPQKEGVVDELTRLLGERGDNLIFEAHVKEAIIQLAETRYKHVPSREEIARRNEEEGDHLATLTPEEQVQYYKERKVRRLKNLRHTSDQLDDLQIYSPDYVADLQQLDPEFMDPLISALRQRPKWQKREKAFERLQRMRQRHMKDHPQGSDGHS
jgi:hypothetical protein